RCYRGSPELPSRRGLTPPARLAPSESALDPVPTAATVRRHGDSRSPVGPARLPGRSPARRPRLVWAVPRAAPPQLSPLLLRTDRVAGRLLDAAGRPDVAGLPAHRHLALARHRRRRPALARPVPRRLGRGPRRPLLAPPPRLLHPGRPHGAGVPHG